MTQSPEAADSPELISVKERLWGLVKDAPTNKTEKPGYVEVYPSSANAYIRWPRNAPNFGQRLLGKAIAAASGKEWKDPTETVTTVSRSVSIGTMPEHPMYAHAMPPRLHIVDEHYMPNQVADGNTDHTSLTTISYLVDASGNWYDQAIHSGFEFRLLTEHAMTWPVSKLSAEYMPRSEETAERFVQEAGITDSPYLLTQAGRAHELLNYCLDRALAQA